MEKKKKPFNETTVGKLLGKVGGILPDSGVLGVLKEVIDNDEELTQQEKEELGIANFDLVEWGEWGE